jgi:para-nitrobenzyl esterase
MASPLARGLFRRAIGESGAFFGDTLRLRTLAESEKADGEFAKTLLGTDSLEALRAMPADKILQVIAKGAPVRFVPNIDGYFLPDSVAAIFAAGKQARVPLLAGWNADEQTYRSILGGDEATPGNFLTHLRSLYGDRGEAILKLYPASTADQVRRSAQDLASDRFIAFGTWKWMEAHLKTGEAPVYRYRFEQVLPSPVDAAPHASEIEFVFQVLSSRKLPWRPADRTVSSLMGSYWSNFAKYGDPNGEDLPLWPVYRPDAHQVMHLNADAGAAPDDRRARYELLDSIH